MTRVSDAVPPSYRYAFAGRCLCNGALASLIATTGFAHGQTAGAPSQLPSRPGAEQLPSRPPPQRPPSVRPPAPTPPIARPPVPTPPIVRPPQPPPRPQPPHRPGAGRPPGFRPIHLPTFHYPRGYRYRRWQIGDRLPVPLMVRAYYFNDWTLVGLGSAPAGYRWIRHGPDLLLVRTSNRRIVDIIYRAFI